MIYKRSFPVVFIFLMVCLFSKAQTVSGIQSIVTAVDTFRSRMPVEKLYIQFDKPYYSTGDTIRLKAYLFDAAMLKGSDKSGIVYIELANDTNRVLFRRMLPVAYGLGTGNIILDKDYIPEGSYTLRAYTNLMRNFGEDLVFKKNFYVSGNSVQNWLVNSQTILSKQSGKDNLRLALQFNLFNKQPLRLHELDIRVLDGKKVVQRDKVKTDAEGKLDVNFNLPENPEAPGSSFGRNDLSVIATDPKDANHRINIPIPVNKDIDLQFMPEGGNLVAGIPSVLGFKAIGEDGKGTEVSGKVYNNRNEEVISFSSSYKGMGSFGLVPKEGESYTAKITLNGTTKDFSLPPIKNTGTTIRVNNPSESDSIEVIVSSIQSSAITYYLIAQSRGIICYGAVIRFNTGTKVTKKVAKSVFPTGITIFTLMSGDNQPLNERITFVDHHDNLNIAITPSQAAYQMRDSIALNIEVKDHEGKPVQGSFSISVTDDSQVRTDSLSNNLLSSVLLTSDLKGTVEDPAYYFQQTEQAKKDLDNVLLTQGWTGYNWKDVFNLPVPAYAAEPEFVVKGKVTNVFNKGSAVTAIQLASLNPSAIKMGVTGKDGSFAFGGLPVAEDLQFFLRAKNKNGKSFNVGIEIEEFKPSEFKPAAQRFVPWYVNSDTILLQQARSVIEEAKFNTKGANLLQEVTITAKKIVKDSKNLNGAGEADQIFDEKDMKKAPKQSLFDLMQERVNGFNMGIWPSKNVPPTGLGTPDLPVRMVSGPGGKGTEPKSILGGSPIWFEKTISYKIFDKEMHLVIDGIDVESLYNPEPGTPFPTTSLILATQRRVDPTGNYILERNAASPTDRRDFIKTFLDGIIAEDVKGIEVMSEPEHYSRYRTKYASNLHASLSVAGPDFAFVEVTTYSGNGAFMKARPGVYLHRPISYVNTAAFYRPKYVVKTNPLSDFRSTIHWEPYIVTDKDGKGFVSFYSADRPGTYSIIMEGSDMNGNIGRKTGKVRIDP